MRLLFDATVFQSPPTGIAKLTVQLYRSCLEISPDLQIIGLHRKPLACELPQGIESRLVGKGLSRKAWQVIMSMHAIANKPSAVHFPANGGVPGFFPRVPVITTLHDILPLQIPGFFKSAEAQEKFRRRTQRDLIRTDVLFTDSEYSRKEIINAFRTTCEPVILYPPLPDWVCGCLDKAPEIPGGYFLYSGGYDIRKGLEALVRVFSSLRRDGKISSRLVLIGEKRLISEEFRQMIYEGRAEGFIEEMGYVSDDTLRDLYSRAVAMVYPSRGEGFGMPPLEAMACGCPVIATRCTSIPEVCGEAAYYLHTHEDEELAESLIALEQNSSLRDTLIGKGKEQARTFHNDRSARTFIEIISDLHSRGSRCRV